MDIEGKTISKTRSATKEEVDGKGFINPNDTHTLVLEFTDGTSILISTEGMLNWWNLSK